MEGVVVGRAAPAAASARLGRLARWCVEGRQAAAELELHAWRREADCPRQAMVLLASLWARRGEIAAAAELLRDSTPGGEAAGGEAADAQSLCLLTALDIVNGPSESASSSLQHLNAAAGHEPSVRAWLAAIHPRGCLDAPALTEAAIDHLACELLVNIDVVASLVAGQKIENNADTIRLLRLALSRALRDIDDERHQLAACQAMAELAMLAGDHDDARRWAHRGLRLLPYCASLALVLARIKDDAMVGPPAAAVLAEAVNAHPKYPDLRAALIRRDFAEGRADVARRRLQQWLRREPNHAVARRLKEELAA